ncbi:MAG: hypothetical protein KAU49_03150 [Candidatus Krumholzibacteria bacterium]|nr:hypothetical protein [Candidatus Krumholzibacteria bacterium]
MRHDSDRWRDVDEAAGADGRYEKYAWRFVFSGVESTMEMMRASGHISGDELLEGLRVIASRQFGPMAKEVLNHWGIYTTRDIGNIVFGLIAAELLEHSDEDSIEEFDDVFDFQKVFEEDYYDDQHSLT